MDQRFLDGDASQTLAKARDGSHRDPIAAEVLVALMDGAGADSADTELDRATAVKSIGPVRLKYMKDDAPVKASGWSRRPSSPSTPPSTKRPLPPRGGDQRRKSG
jgi:hypothetical protein